MKKGKRTDRKINICGAWYKIIHKPFVDDEAYALGLHSYDDRTIEINSEVTDNRLESICAHEVTHAILDLHSIDKLLEKYVDEEVREEIEEAICRAMETGYKAFRNI